LSISCFIFVLTFRKMELVYKKSLLRMASYSTCASLSI
jgi:hypothetical protein